MNHQTTTDRPRTRLVVGVITTLAMIIVTLFTAQTSQAASPGSVSTFLNHQTGNSNFTYTGEGHSWNENSRLSAELLLEFATSSGGPWYIAQEHDKTVSSTTAIAFPTYVMSQPPCSTGFYRSWIRVTDGHRSATATSPAHWIVAGGGPVKNPARPASGETCGTPI